MTLLLTLLLITLKVLFAFAASIFFVWVMFQLDDDMRGDK